MCAAGGLGKTGMVQVRSGFGELPSGSGAGEAGADVFDVGDGLFEQLADVVVVEVVDDLAPVTAPSPGQAAQPRGGDGAAAAADARPPRTPCRPLARAR